MRHRTTVRAARYLLAALSGLVLLFSMQGCNSEEVPCTWARGPMVVDGRGLDWQGMAGLHLKEQNAALSVANDNDFLYILFKTTDEKWARTIRQTGLTLYVDARGKKSKDFYVRFRGGPKREQMASRPSRGDDQNAQTERRMPEGGMGMMEEQPVGLTCYIKDKILEKTIPEDGQEGPAAAYDTCQGFYTYEFRVPLSEVGVRYYGIGATPGQIIGIGGVWGDMGEMDGKAPGGGTGGGPPGGGGMPGSGMGGGPPGGGGGMGGGPPGGGQRPDMTEKQEVWVKTTLAQPRTEVSSEN